MKITKLVTPLVILSSLSTPLLAQADGNDKIKVMSRNLYLGADIFQVVAASQSPDPLAVPQAVAGVFQTMAQTDFPQRAEALADEVARYRPHAIGLQEVSIISRQSPGDFLLGNPTPAEDVVYDYLSILQAALVARGLNYEVAVSVDNADIELPMLTGVTDQGVPTFDDVRLQDRDIILVKEGVTATNQLAQNFQVNVETTIGGNSVAFTRGYTAADVTVRGDTYRFVNTHLETGGSEPFKSLQAIQMNELLTVIDLTNPVAHPVVLVGDLNSDPRDEPFVSSSGIPGLDGLPLVPPYLQAVATGWFDVWAEHPRNQRKTGYTCCFDANVNDPTAQLTSRIDHILLQPNGHHVLKMKAKVIGDDLMDMTEGGLYPSDHAGVVGKVKLQR